MFGFHVSRLPFNVPALYVPPPKAAVVCVGNPSVLPECMAPLAGSMLAEAGLRVFGTLYEPVDDEEKAVAAQAKGPRRRGKRLVVKAVTSSLQPGFAELEAHPAQGVWRLYVHLPKTAHYAEVIHFARETCHAVKSLMDSSRYVLA